MSPRLLLLQVWGQGLLCSGFTVHGSLGGCPGPGALAGFVPVKDGAVPKCCPRLPDFSAPPPPGGALWLRSVLAFLRGWGCLRCRLFSAPRGLCQQRGRWVLRSRQSPWPSAHHWLIQHRAHLLQWGVDPGACLIYAESQKVRDLRALGRVYLDSVWFVCRQPLVRSTRSHACWTELLPLGALPTPLSGALYVCLRHPFRIRVASGQAGPWETPVQGPAHQPHLTPTEQNLQSRSFTLGTVCQAVFTLFLYISLPFGCKGFQEKQPSEASMMIRLLALGSFCDNADCVCLSLSLSHTHTHTHTHTHILYSEM